jgi:3'-phosphoadenosine 5'-phosphosulfate sulfotransferase
VAGYSFGERRVREEERTGTSVWGVAVVGAKIRRERVEEVIVEIGMIAARGRLEG